MSTPEIYRGWRRHTASCARDRDAFWSWVDQGYPQRYAFWRARDEFDGLLLGTALGLLVALVVLLVSIA